MGISERKNREKELRRQQIQQAAKELCIVKGLRSTTIEDIAERAELSPGTIYLYFKNKGDLYASLNLIGLKRLTDEIEKVYKNKSLTVEEKIMKYKDAMYNNFKQDPLLQRVIFHIQLEDTLLTIDKKTLTQLNRLAQKMMNMIANTYEDGIRKRKTRNGHGMVHADIMWATFAGLVLWEEAKRKINPQKDFLRTTLDRAFEIFIKGLKQEGYGNSQVRGRFH
jgi:AcrR family transcriptional regulator